MRRCAKLGCLNAGTWKPVLLLFDGEPIRLELPMVVCSAHRQRTLSPSLVTPKMMRKIRAMLRERGLKMPPWAKAQMEFDPL